MNIGCPCHLRVAEKGLYRPRWSDRLLAEAQAATEQIHPGVDAGKRSAQMREAFDDALVTGWEELEPGIRLPGQDDRHVLTAAVRGGAQGIITANTKDFPAAALEPLGLAAGNRHPQAATGLPALTRLRVISGRSWTDVEDGHGLVVKSIPDAVGTAAS